MTRLLFRALLWGAIAKGLRDGLRPRIPLTVQQIQVILKDVWTSEALQAQLLDETLVDPTPNRPDADAFKDVWPSQALREQLLDPTPNRPDADALWLAAVARARAAPPRFIPPPALPDELLDQVGQKLDYGDHAFHRRIHEDLAEQRRCFLHTFWDDDPACRVCGQLRKRP